MLVVDDIAVFCIIISGTVCMLFVRRFVVVAVAVADVVMTIVPLLPFLCAILVFVDLSRVFDEMLICLHLFSTFGVCVGDYYLLAVLVGADGIRSLTCCF